jgi:tetratricopeptide (TPR) repeat protein
LWPDNAVARYYAARAAEQVGDFDRAVDEYRFSIRAGPGATDARVRLARLHLAEGSPQLALAVIQTDLARSATPEAILLQLEIAAQRGEIGRLPEYVERVVRTPELWPRAVAAMARGTRRRAGPGAGEQVVRGQRLDLTQPVNAPALRELVVSLLEASQAQAALRLVDSAARGHPEVAAFHEIRGLALAGGGEASAARSAYERAVELEPENAAALAGLARLADRAGDAEAALDLYARAAAADAADAAPLVSAAELLIRLGRGAEAEQHLAEALGRDPYDGEAALRLAELRLARGLDGARTRKLLKRAARFGSEREAAELLERVGAEPPAPDPPA